jgi:hypothetical protein
MAKRVLEDTPIAAATAVGLAKEGEAPSIPVASSPAPSAFNSTVDEDDDNFQSLFGSSPVAGDVFDETSTTDGSEDDLDIPDFLR